MRHLPFFPALALSLTFLVVGITSPLALAQNTPSATIPEESLIPKSQGPTGNTPYDSYSEIPEEALEQAEIFHESCLQNPKLQKHYNCDCMAAQYVDAYIKLGPNANQSNILPMIKPGCIDFGAAAATVYNRCMRTGSITFNSPTKTPDEYCECAGNAYARSLQDKPPKRITENLYQRLRMRALRSCK